jgi:hypothetical protein
MSERDTRDETIEHLKEKIKELQKEVEYLKSLPQTYPEDIKTEPTQH